VVFHEKTDPKRIARYKADLKYFTGLRRTVQHIYAETIDYSAYERQVRKLLDAHVQAQAVTTITPMVDIYDVEAVAAAVEQVEGTAAKADAIASRIKRTATERMDEDPVRWKRFAELVKQAIDDYREGRISDVEFLKRMQGYQDAIVGGREEDIPAPLRGRPTAQAYFGVLGEVLANYPDRDADARAELAADMAVAIDDRIQAHGIRDWIHNADVQQQMTDAIDDYLFELRDRAGLALDTADMDAIIERCLDIARKRARL